MLFHVRSRHGVHRELTNWFSNDKTFFLAGNECDAIERVNIPKVFQRLSYMFNGKIH